MIACNVFSCFFVCFVVPRKLGENDVRNDNR